MIIHLKYSEYCFTSKGLVKASKLKTNMFLRGEDTIVKIEKVQRSTKKVLEVTLKNGLSFLLDEANILTSNGLKNKVNLSYSDYVGFSLRNDFNIKKTFDLNYDDEEAKGYCMPINIGDIEINEDFAEMCGMIVSSSNFKLSSYFLELNIERVQEQALSRFIELSKKVFNATPVIKQKTEYTYIRLHSNNLIKFVLKHFGIRRKIRSVPSFITQSPNHIRAAFFKGIIFNRLMTEHYPLLYNGSSKQLSIYLMYYMYSIGYGVFLAKYKKDNNDAFQCFLIYSTKFQKDLLLKTNGSPLVRIPDEFLKLKIPSDHILHRRFNQIKKNKVNVIYKKTLDKLDLPYPDDILFSKIKYIKEYSIQHIEVTVSKNICKSAVVIFQNFD